MLAASGAPFAFILVLFLGIGTEATYLERPLWVSDKGVRLQNIWPNPQEQQSRLQWQQQQQLQQQEYQPEPQQEQQHSYFGLDGNAGQESQPERPNEHYEMPNFGLEGSYLQPDSAFQQLRPQGSPWKQPQEQKVELQKPYYGERPQEGQQAVQSQTSDYPKQQVPQWNPTEQKVEQQQPLQPVPQWNTAEKQGEPQLTGPYYERRPLEGQQLGNNPGELPIQQVPQWSLPEQQTGPYYERRPLEGLQLGNNPGELPKQQVPQWSLPEQQSGPYYERRPLEGQQAAYHPGYQQPDESNTPSQAVYQPIPIPVANEHASQQPFGPWGADRPEEQQVSLPNRAQEERQPFQPYDSRPNQWNQPELNRPVEVPQSRPLQPVPEYQWNQPEPSLFLGQQPYRPPQAPVAELEGPWKLPEQRPEAPKPPQTPQWTQPEIDAPKPFFPQRPSEPEYPKLPQRNPGQQPGDYRKPDQQRPSEGLQASNQKETPQVIPTGPYRPQPYQPDYPGYPREQPAGQQRPQQMKPQQIPQRKPQQQQPQQQQPSPLRPEVRVPGAPQNQLNILQMPSWETLYRPDSQPQQLPKPPQQPQQQPQPQQQQQYVPPPVRKPVVAPKPQPQRPPAIPAEPSYNRPVYNNVDDDDDSGEETWEIPVSRVDPRCPRNDDPAKPVHLASPLSCVKFQKCFNGIAYEMSCPPGLEFDATRNRCDYPAMANCSRGTR